MSRKLIPYIDEKGKEVENYKVYSVGGNIYFRKMIDGEEISFSTGVKNITKAKMIAGKRLKKDFGKAKVATKSTIGEELQIYLAARLKEDIGKSTKKNIKNAIRDLMPFWKHKMAFEITSDEWLEYCEWHKFEYGTQVENAHKYFKAFCRWLHQPRKGRGSGIPFIPILKNPESKSVRINRKRKKERVFTPEEFTKIYRVCEGDRKLLVTLMYTMAFRVESDALSARWAQFKLDAEVPYFYFGEGDNKAGLEGRQAIHSLALRLLIQQRNISGHSEFVFPLKNNPTQYTKRGAFSWGEVKEKSGVSWGWTPHTFRHSCLTNLAERGFPQHLICKCFRISNQEFMETYAHLTPEGLLKMQNAIEVKE